jgi:hypothetical protein
MITAETIKKEDIPNLNFSKREVLSDPHKRLKRLDDLFRSQSLGNLRQSKVKLTFKQETITFAKWIPPSGQSKIHLSRLKEA